MSSATQRELEQLKQQYGVTVKVVKAQGEYINDLESKNLALAKHIKEGKSDGSMMNISTEDYSRRVADLKRGAEYYKQAHETTQKENSELREQLVLYENRLKSSGKADIVNIGNNKRWNKSDIRTKEQLVQLQKVHSNSAEAWAVEKASLTGLIEKNQTITTRLQETLARERAHKEMEIDVQVKNRVESIVSTANSGVETVELASLRVECERLRSLLEERDNHAADNTDKLAMEITKLRETIYKERKENDGKVEKLEEHLRQTRKLFQERELVIAEERKAFEDEVDLVRETSKKKENALRRQAKDLSEQLESLTNHLAQRGASDDPKEREDIASIKAEYEERLRNVLQLREQSEEKMLLEKKQLIEEFKRLEHLRDEREKQKEKEFHSRFAEADAMLKAWEQRDSSIKADARAARERMESATNAANDRDNQLMEEIENIRKANARIMKLAEGREKANAMEVEALRSEMVRLQTAYDRRDVTSADLNEIHAEEVELLNKLLELATIRVHASVSDDDEESKSNTGLNLEKEKQTLIKQIDQLRNTNLEREVALATFAETSKTTEMDLRRALSEAVDTLESEQVLKQEAIDQYNGEIARLRKHIEQANDAHSKSEATAAREIGRLNDELSKLKANLKDQRLTFEKGVHEQEIVVKKQIEAYTNESKTLRELMEKLHRQFRIYREHAERERTRLTAEIERVDAEKINIFELMREKEEVHAETVKELETRLERQRKELDEVEVTNVTLRDQIHNEENLSLPALWLKRQEETKEAFGRSTEEIEMLRDRLRDQEKDRLEEQKPIFVEIALLRDAQQSHDLTVQSRDKLWAEERQRLREEVDLTEQRVQKAEENYAMKMEVIDNEIKAIKEVKDQNLNREQNRVEFIQKERESLNTQRETMQANYDAKVGAMEGHRNGLEDELTRLKKAVEMQKQLMAATKDAIDAQYREQIITSEQRASTAEDLLATEQDQIHQQKAIAAEAEKVMTDELNELRSELHHLRKITTEKHLELSREKSLLISEIERLSKAPGDKTNVAATMRNQIESIEEAAREREEAYQQQINQLENNLSKQRRLNEERASQHEVELTSYKEIARLEAGPGDRKSRNTKMQEEKEQKSFNAAIASLREQIRHIRGQADRERNSLQSQMDEMQSSIGRREERLKQQIINLESRNDIMSRQLEQSINDIGSAGKGVSELVKEVKSKADIEIKSLRQQNQLLVKQVNEMQDEMEDRERIYRQKHDKIVKSFHQLNESYSTA